MFDNSIAEQRRSLFRIKSGDDVSRSLWVALDNRAFMDRIWLDFYTADPARNSSVQIMLGNMVGNADPRPFVIQVLFSIISPATWFMETCPWSSST